MYYMSLCREYFKLLFELNFISIASIWTKKGVRKNDAKCSVISDGAIFKRGDIEYCSVSLLKYYQIPFELI